MINLKSRSQQKELLDADGIPFADIKENMQELERINRLLGGHAISVNGLRQLMPERNKKIVLCEIGCGGGDNLRALYKFCSARKIDVQLIGIDIKQQCIDYATEKNNDLPATWICDDYKKVFFAREKPDIIFSSLFCHHFPENELVFMMQWMQQNSGTGFFINDLQRHPLAYHAIRMLTSIFSNSYLVKNDAPLSVARGFKKAEWEKILTMAGLQSYRIHWQWAFRYLIVLRHA